MTKSTRDLDGTVWEVETMDEAEAAAVVHALLPMIVERRPLAWLRERSSGG